MISKASDLKGKRVESHMPVSVLGYRKVTPY